MPFNCHIPTANYQAVKDEACSGGAVARRALAVAERIAALLVRSYAAQPYYDVSGEAYEEAVSVVQLCPLIRQALDIGGEEEEEEGDGVDREEGKAWQQE